jgi:hypothetical protein
VKVSDPSDRFEREASANADAIMSQPAAPAAPVQRCDDGCGDTEVQRLAEPTVQREDAPEPAEEDPEAMAQTYVQREAEDEEMADA